MILNGGGALQCAWYTSIMRIGRGGYRDEIDDDRAAVGAA